MNTDSRSTDTDHRSPEQPLAHLRALAGELTSLGLIAEIRGTETDSPDLRTAASTSRAAARQRITCQPAPAGGWRYCWSWGQPISPADDPAATAATIAATLRKPIPATASRPRAATTQSDAGRRAGAGRRPGSPPGSPTGPGRTSPRPVTRLPARPAEHVMASDPLLRLDAITAHARDHRRFTWPSHEAAADAISDAIAAITPRDCTRDPEQGTITSPPLAALPGCVPWWDDPQLLNCIIATLAATPPDCDLQDIHDETDYVARPRTA